MQPTERARRRALASEAATSCTRGKLPGTETSERRKATKTGSGADNSRSGLGVRDLTSRDRLYVLIIGYRSPLSLGMLRCR